MTFLYSPDVAPKSPNFFCVRLFATFNFSIQLLVHSFLILLEQSIYPVLFNSLIIPLNFRWTPTLFIIFITIIIIVPKQFIFTKTKKDVKNVEQCFTRYMLDLNMENVKVKVIIKEKSYMKITSKASSLKGYTRFLKHFFNSASVLLNFLINLASNIA